MFKKAIFIFFSLLLLGGCVQFQTGESEDMGGVFVSNDRGDHWKNMSLIATPGSEVKSIKTLDAYDIGIDPSYRRAVYFASESNGIFYTYDIRDGWMAMENFPKDKAQAVSVNPEDKCVIYAASYNRVYKTEDCGRIWNAVYYDNEDDTVISDVTIDHYNTNRIYISTSRGDILQSVDRGESWRVATRTDDYATGVFVNPRDSRIVFATTRKEGVFRSLDGGYSWSALEEKMEDFDNSSRTRDIGFSYNNDDVVFLATNYGLLRSEDNGETWGRIDLVSPEEDAIINDIAISPKNDQEIYYVTNTTFYRSVDRGQTWSTIDLPTTRAGRRITIDPEETNLIYLGVYTKKKKGMF